MVDVPRELLEAAAVADVVPVLGDALNPGPPEGAASGDQLALLLGAKLNLPVGGIRPAKDLPILVSQYEALRGRHALIALLRQQMGAPDPVIPNELLLAVRLASQALITTSVSLNAETALRRIGNATSTVIIDPIATWYTSQERQPWLIKLAGCLSQPESVALSSDRLMRLSTSIDQLELMVRGILLTKTLVFIAYGLGDPFLEALHTLLQMSSTHSRRRYILTEEIADDERVIARVWESRGYEVVSGPLCAMLEQLVDASDPAGRSIAAVAPQNVHSLRPFKFLDYYTEQESKIYFGRDDEAESLATIIATNPLTVIVGPSGVGKTSLVNAGLIPRLHAKGYDTCTIRALDHPTKEILNALRLKEGGEGWASEDLRTALSSYTRKRPLVVTIDQFEEFFLRVGPGARRDFAEQLYACLRDASLDIRLAFVIRDDFLHHLLELSPPLDKILRSHFVVRRLSRGQVGDVLKKIFQEIGIEIDPELVARLMEDLDDDGIDPCQLQIIGHTLQREIPPGSSSVKAELYGTLGGTDAILARYLDHTLDVLAAELLPVAKGVLQCMVSADRTKNVMSTKEIARDVITRRLDVSDDILQRVLHDLMQARVIRSVQGRGEEVFELAHDVLAAKVWGWIEPRDIELKYVRQLLQQSTVDWRQVKILPSRPQWELVERHREELEFSPSEALFALHAAYHYDSGVTWWTAKAEQCGVDVWAECTRMLGTESPPVRLAVLNWAVGSPNARKTALLELALLSEYPAVRRVARRAMFGETPRHAGGDEPVFVDVPGGDFLFGTDDLRFEHSQPCHRVTVSAFAIQRYPVTNYEYRAFVRATGHRAPDHWEGGEPPYRLMEHPVVQVSWWDATEYCAWFAAEAGLPTRLPTAAEWEKAAGWDPLKGTQSYWSWGNTFDPAKGNSRVGGPGSTTPIGQYTPASGDSPCGVADMCGNTFDWVSDWWAPGHDPTEVVDPQGPPTGQHKCARGGSWAGSAEGTSVVSNKYSLSPGTRNEYVGFRMAYTVADAS
ncbi:SUMF1/EgtB/PvdO family nonheme iron enzyme [Streptomyces sp. SS7]|uniref:nSTAND1 domain-containing NTPase n=1 Tax=Streptomyces sp. SS7 TaxID=3108485 RepID=UPI0030EC6905